MAAATRVKESGAIASPYAILIILALINFLNYVDRMVISGLVPFLQAPPSAGGLGLSNTETGLLQSAFMAVHALASIPLGIAADRFLRKRLIAIGVGLWSVATALAGLARGFLQLFVSRAAVGIGEASYAPAATALISDHFEQGRARALGVFQMGMVLGGGVGIIIGGWVGGHWGWRYAFFVVGVPGLVLTLVALAIRERPRPADPRRGSMWSVVRGMFGVVFRSPGVGWIYVSGILITFMVGSFQFWGIKYIIRYHYQGNEEMTARVVAAFGPLVVGASVAGVLLGSIAADWLDRRHPGKGRLMVVGLGPLIGAPFVAAGLATSNLTALYISLGIGTAMSAAYAGPVLAALHEVVGKGARATATGAYFFIVHLLGDGPSPTVVGAVADSTGSLRAGMYLAAAMAVLGGIAALIGVKGAAEAVKSNQLSERGTAETHV